MNISRAQIAKNHYLGKPNFSRLNCAQSVLMTWQDKCPIAQTVFDSAQNYGGGRAPNGICGALAAAQMILQQYQPDQIEALNAEFEQAAGSIYCKQIRSLKKLPCPDCVAKAAELLDQLLD